MKKLLIILAVLVMDARDEERLPGTKPCGCAYKTQRQQKIATVTKENFLLVKLQG